MSEDELTVILASMQKVLTDLIEERIALPEKIRDAKARGDSSQLMELTARDECLPRLIAEVDWNATHLAATLDRMRRDRDATPDPCRDEDGLDGLALEVDGHTWCGRSQYLRPEMAPGSAATTP